MLSTMFRSRRDGGGGGGPRARASSIFSSIRDFPRDNEDLYESANSNESRERSPLLPIFAANLDAIPVYNLVHTIRSEIVSRVDTTLSWSQLRTPQVSSFLVKPILANLLQVDEKNAKGLLYSLMANCLQFRKEAKEKPGSSGSSSTRAFLCELLAIKCLKEFSTRELIDALSYDFYPLQGMPPPTTASSSSIYGQRPTATPMKSRESASRISALEVAIRSQAKKFLAHPVVIQQLEAIWAGNVVFYSHYDQIRDSKEEGGMQPTKKTGPWRRSASIYDGRDASLFKLSRLRVPRYRHILSTLSLTILLLLHLKVLMERSYTITPLEILFWLWSSGFMIDEIVDFNEFGVSLYFMSLWNTFDIGIFLLFVTFYIMRIAGLFIPQERDYITDWSFDILASCSVFLFPRIFSILDHYRYFSQLIIAFRIMAADMLALLVVIIVSCSGFFVAFTFSFAREYASASDVSYELFQILMGFTPAAWEVWSQYNMLGKFLLTAFLIICHFLIVTILITVLTNSFAAVAANAQEEHQFLVAVNTISLVKNEAVFTYVAPMNLIAWVLHPLRYFMPFRKYVRLNRTIVKITHFPILLIIYLYESTILRNSIFTPADAVEGHDPLNHKTLNAIKQPGQDRGLLSPRVRRRLRRDSMGSQQQERILEEVFRKPYKVGNRGAREGAVDSWVNDVISASPPSETGFSMRRKYSRRGKSNGLGTNRFNRDNYGTLRRQPPPPPPSTTPRRDFSVPRSVISDPEDYKRPLSEAETPGITRTEESDTDNEAEEGGISESDHSKCLLVDEKASDLSDSDSSIDDDGDDNNDPPSPIRRTPPMILLRPTLSDSRHHSRTNSSNTVLFKPPVRETNAFSDDDDEESRLESDLQEDLEDDVLSGSFASRMHRNNGEETGMLNRILLARMGKLEESVKDVREMLMRGR